MNKTNLLVTLFTSLLTPSLFIAAAVQVNICQAGAQTAPVEQANDDTNIITRRYNEAKLIHTEDPKYPRRELKRGQEGWVIYSVQVDANGGVSNPLVVDSSGSKDFERSGAKALEQSKYQPATLNGKAIASTDNRVKVTFSIQTSRPGANERFFKLYNRARKLINKGQLADAAKTIKQLEEYSYNLYEYKSLELIKAKYDGAAGQLEQQLTHLERATLDDSQPLPKATLNSALQQQFYLQLGQMKFNKALATAEKLENRIKDKKAIEKVLALRDKALEQLEKMPSYSVDGHIDSEHHWHHSLSRKRFELATTKGALSELHLRCDNKVRQFKLDNTGKQFTIPEDWGQCDLLIWGDVGSEFFINEIKLTAQTDNTGKT